MNLEAARRQMIDQQVRAWEVLDDVVLDTLAAVPREHFVPQAYTEVAFADGAIPLEHGQHMLPPKVEGRILQALAINRDDAILEVGTGSGFFAACLARLGREVQSLEIFADMARDAAERLRERSVTNVTVECADAMLLEVRDRYDVIAMTGSLPVYDARFEKALTVGGRLFVVVGSAPIMEARLVTRSGPAEWISTSLFETSIDPLLNAAAAPRFQF